MKSIYFAYKSIRKVVTLIVAIADRYRVRFIFGMNRVAYGTDLRSNGVPTVSVATNGRFWIGSGFRMNNGWNHNRIGRQQPCQFIVGESAELMIGNHVGISSTTIVCLSQIHIGEHVKIGGNVVIYDTDFHSLDAQIRMDPNLDIEMRSCEPVSIGHHAFIGAHSTILKGVRIGNYAIIGSGSVVTKDIPPYEVWAGNPARFIRRINPEEQQQAA